MALRQFRRTILAVRLREIVVALSFLALAGLVALKLGQPERTLYAGPAEAVDGDTIIVDGVRLRLAGIDAPEIRQTCKTGASDWQCGLAARDALARMIRLAGLECRSTKLDKWRRPLVACKAGSLELNREMVLTGMAVSYGDFGPEEAEAKADRRGLWDSVFERPQDWRKRTRHASADGEADEGEMTEPVGFWDRIGLWLGF